MKNKKGFTLVELIAVIAILGALLLIAVPSITALQTRIEKDQIKEDADMFILLAKQKIKTDTGLNPEPPDNRIEVKINQIDQSKLNGEYNTNSSVTAKGCGFNDNDIFTCNSYTVNLENDKYVYDGTNFTKK